MPSLTIRTDEDRSIAVKLLGKVQVPFSVQWQAGRNRSREQNALQWRWAAEVARQRGDMDQTDVQAEWKLRHGVPILRAENEEFRQMYDSHIKPLPYHVKLRMLRSLDIGVTREMKVSQMTRYLDAVQRETLEIGISLTDPGGLK